MIGSKAELEYALKEIVKNFERNYLKAQTEASKCSGFDQRDRYTKLYDIYFTEFARTAGTINFFKDKFKI